MHAILLYAFGPAENLRYEAVPDPVPAADEVRIAVEASGVHLIDTTLRRGIQMGPPLPELPAIPGREVAGTVDAVGPGVDERWVGRRVVAHLGPTGRGGYAELALALAGSLHELPDHVAADAAVAMIGTGRTAVGILELAALTRDDVVLVLAAAGGLGSLFLQAGRNAGATVVGAAGGPDKVERVRALGAHVAADYAQADWPDRVREALGDRRVSVVLDGVGGEVGRAALELLGVGGRLVLFGWSAGEPTAVTTQDVMKGLTVTGLGPRLLPRLRELETRSLGELAAGHLKPVIQHFPLARAADAHGELEARATTGKVVLVPTRGG